MVWKIVILSIAIVIASFIIAGAIVATQVLSGNLNVDYIEGQGPGNSEQEPVPTIEGEKISIVENDGSSSYNPNPIEIRTGDTITWVNDDSAIHTATASDGTFDSDILRRGETFSFTFDNEGEYPYYCDVHPNMVGTVVVMQDGESGA
ncbi:MAG: cupredoxin family copper-binding protein [Thermoproteota archaeon]